MDPISVSINGTFSFDDPALDIFLRLEAMEEEVRLLKQLVIQSQGNPKSLISLLSVGEWMTSADGSVVLGSPTIEELSMTSQGRWNTVAVGSHSTTTTVNAVITELASISTKMAPHTVFVVATDSDLGSPSNIWSRARIQWNFDGTNQETSHLTCTDPRNGNTVDIATAQEGFVAAYCYNTPGTYQIRLTVTNETGSSHTATKNITVVASSHTVLYVAAGGNNGNPGTSPGAAWLTLDYAMSQVQASSNIKLLFNRGDTFTTAIRPHSISGKNWIMDAYGSGANPKIKYTGPALAGGSDGSQVFDCTTASENVQFRNINFEGPSLDSHVNFVKAGPRLSVIGCSADLIGKFIAAVNNDPDGVFVLNCNTGTHSNNPSAGDYPFIGRGVHRFVLLGTTVPSPSIYHSLRWIQATGWRDNKWLSIAWCDWFHDGAAGTSTMRVGHIQYGHMFRNRSQGAAVQTGFHKGFAYDVIWDGNLLYANYWQQIWTLNNNVNRVMMRNNVLYWNNLAPAPMIWIKISTGAEPANTVDNLDIINNTFYMQQGTASTFPYGFYTSGNPTSGNQPPVFQIASGFPISNVRFLNNLVTAESASHDDRIFHFDNGGDHGISLVSGNVYPVFSNSFYREQGVNKNWTSWLAEAFVSGGNEAQENVLSTTIAQPGFTFNSATYPVASAQGAPTGGVFKDYNGALRTGANWSAGATEND